MKQTVYLLERKVYLKIDLNSLHSPMMAFEVANEIAGALIAPSKIVDGEGNETTTPELGTGSFSVNVSAFSAIRLDNGKLGSILSVSRPGLIGMFFYCEGDDFMTEMANPDTQRVAEIIEGEEEEVF